MIRTHKVAAAAAMAVALLSGCEVPEDDGVTYAEQQTAKREASKGSSGVGETPVADEPEAEVAADPEPAFTAGQENAIAKAEEYLSFGAFSRRGLIDQLKFEGFSQADAAFGVDHLKINWKEQAAAKAEEYLGQGAFSRQGLIDQLKFEGFNQRQAEHGVTQAGL